MTKILLGIDGGGTKTECVALADDGRFARALGPGSNYQGVGIAAATKVWRELLQEVTGQLGADPTAIVAAGLGLSGLDRPKDEARIRPAITALLPTAQLELVNDAYLALRGGTPDGIGVGVVSGTGCNAMGTNARGERFRVGGLGPEFGDLGSASDIGTEGLRSAFRGQDDRGPQTRIAELVMARLGLDRLDDLVDFFIVDNQPDSDETTEFDLGHLAPLVFQAAGEGDGEAIRILQWAGRELGLSARAVARNLFARDERFTLVLGGSVLQKGATPHLRQALEADVAAEFPRVHAHLLTAPPVVGALRYAVDCWQDAGAETRSALTLAIDSHFKEQP